jgi:hypothetical protein
MGKAPDAYIRMAQQVRAHMEEFFGRTAIIKDSDNALEQRFEVLFCGQGNAQ